ncbi:hypothetical protein FA15DRAFT_710921 [Coprinopsis marcescibilis]|uniref:Uncharacterized protein n=1 Tax=Coprinopsis marcescibilis TaxID=230819 RepID=A0A5C3KB58_COPMA|nr:hypothetical protein FA15DRAFT_710921 [Coprinopsis marcescibilis]
MEFGQIEESQLTPSEEAELKIYKDLLTLSAGLEERLLTGSEQELFYIADMLSKGASTSCSDDTRTLKGAVIDWITPKNTLLTPPLSRNIKTDCGFYHNRTGELLCPAMMDWNDINTRDRLRSGQIIPSGDQWPLFLYQNYNYDHNNPWKGLLCSFLLITAFKHIFTSPSSVEKSENRSTQSGNARIHGMKSVTVASLAYVATQVQFALSSTPRIQKNKSKSSPWLTGGIDDRSSNTSCAGSKLVNSKPQQMPQLFFIGTRMEGTFVNGHGQSPKKRVREFPRAC